MADLNDAGSGIPRGENLHSRYNPQAEAARYVDSLRLKDTLKCFILIEPGLGYIIPVLAEKFKNGKIIALHIDNFESGEIITSEAVPSGMQVISRTFPPETHPSQIQGFLETHIQDENTDNIKIIEWRPSLNFYKEAYLNLLSEVVDFLKRADAGQRTASVFGRRWIRNFFRNLKYLKKILLYRQSGLPVIITGSGPGLENALPFIREAQSNYLIIAASSSVMALAHYNITPDIIITTDGTPWALWHLIGGIRDDSLSETLMAFNLCAALPSQCADMPKLILNDGSLWQSVILNKLSIPSIIIPQRGTVSATAVELAMTLSHGGIYLAGMDFSYSDIKTHVKPYSFDSLFFGRACRSAPLYTELYSRSFLSREGGSMYIYASWFKTQLSLWPKRVYSITNGNNIFEYKDISLLKKTPVKLKDTRNDFKIKEDHPRQKEEDINISAAQALLDAIRNDSYKEKLTAELRSLVFAGDTDIDITQKELETEILKVSNG